MVHVMYPEMVEGQNVYNVYVYMEKGKKGGRANGKVTMSG